MSRASLGDSGLFGSGGKGGLARAEGRVLGRNSSFLFKRSSPSAFGGKGYGSVLRQA